MANFFQPHGDASEELSAARRGLPRELQNLLEKQSQLASKLRDHVDLLEQEILSHFPTWSRLPSLEVLESTDPDKSHFSKSTFQEKCAAANKISKAHVPLCKTECSTRKSNISNAAKLTTSGIVPTYSDGMSSRASCESKASVDTPASAAVTSQTLTSTSCSSGKRSVPEKNSRGSHFFTAQASRITSIKRAFRSSGRSSRPGRNSRASSIFPDIEEMKTKARANSKKMETSSSFNVESTFKTNLVGNIVSNERFETMAIFITVLNILWLWIDADLNKSNSIMEAQLVFQAMENVFCGYYTLEYVMRFLALKSKRDALHGWLALDGVLLLLTVWETWLCVLVYLSKKEMVDALQLSGILRPLRALRLMRMVRILHVAPGLMIILRTIPAAAKSVSNIGCILLGALYFFAILMKYLRADEQYFPTVSRGLLSLFFHGVLLDSPYSVAMQLLDKDGIPAFIVFVSFVLLAAVTVMNLLIGVMCQAVGVVAEVEKDRVSRQRAAETIRALVLTGDEDDDMYISRHEFKKMLDDPETTRAFKAMDVDVSALVDTAEVMFQSDATGMLFDKALHLEEFLDVIMKMRGCNAATVKDIVGLRTLIHKECNRQQRHLSRLEEEIWVEKLAIENRNSVPRLLGSARVDKEQQEILRTIIE